MTPSAPSHARTFAPNSMGLFVAALIITALLGIAFLGSRGLYESTEGRYVETARETKLSGDWDDPILNGSYHWTKPPLTYLAIMAGIETFGPSPWGARAFQVLAWLLAVVGVGWAGSVLWNRRAGGLAALVMATSPYMAGASATISTDMLLTAWTALAVAAFWNARLNSNPFLILGAGILLGLGVFTKGPAALLVPATIITTALLSTRGAASGARNQLPWIVAGWAIFLLTGFGWFVSESIHHKGLMSYWLGKELAARYLSDEFHRNPSLAYVGRIYLPVLLLGTGTWLLLYAWLKRKELNGRLCANAWKDTRTRSLAVGVLLPFLVFSVSKSKLPLYLAPIFVPLCLLLGRGYDRLLEACRMAPKTIRLHAVTLIFLILGCKAIAALPERPKDMTRLAMRIQTEHNGWTNLTLHSVGRHPLNGLEFHLGRLIPNHTFTEFGAQFGSLSTGDAYLIQVSDWRRLNLPEDAFIRTRPVGPHWLLITRESNARPVHSHE